MRSELKPIIVRTCLAAVLLVGNISAASAGPITFSFTGTVTSFEYFPADWDDPDDPYGGTIDFETAISGSYTFESLSPDLIPADPQTASYQSAGPLYPMNATIGGHAFGTDDSLAIFVGNDLGTGVDQYGAMGCAVSCDDYQMQLFFEDDTGTAFTSDALPLSPPPIASFASRTFYLNGIIDAEGNRVEINGSIDSLSEVTAVPEPASLLLLGSGMTMGLARRWWTRRRDRSRQS